MWQCNHEASLFIGGNFWNRWTRESWFTPLILSGKSRKTVKSNSKYKAPDELSSSFFFYLSHFLFANSGRSWCSYSLQSTGCRSVMKWSQSSWWSNSLERSECKGRTPVFTCHIFAEWPTFPDTFLLPFFLLFFIVIFFFFTLLYSQVLGSYCRSVNNQEDEPTNKKRKGVGERAWRFSVFGIVPPIFVFVCLLNQLTLLFTLVLNADFSPFFLFHLIHWFDPLPLHPAWRAWRQKISGPWFDDGVICCFTASLTPEKNDERQSILSSPPFTNDTDTRCR